MKNGAGGIAESISPDSAITRNLRAMKGNSSMWRLALVFLLLLPLCAQQKDAGASLPATNVQRKQTLPRAADTSVIVEVFKNFTVAPGQSVAFDAVSDFTRADKANVGIQCPASTDLHNVQLQFFWTLPGADFYVGTDFANGTSLAFTNMGGAVVAVFGSSLRILVMNKGTVAAQCNQLSIYALVH
jgi:hypothetical protein